MLFRAALVASSLARSVAASSCDEDAASSKNALNDTVFRSRVVVNDQVMGARSVVAGDLDGDGDADLVSASSTDNTVAWYENLGGGRFSAKRKITYDAKGARVAALGDVDGDGVLDVVYASYYDNTLAWFRNDGAGGFGSKRVISDAVDEGQGVCAADLDGDGDLDVATASSGDNTIAWFENLGGGGAFCEIKRVVDSAALGARAVVAADLNGDGLVDLASASKDDNTIAMYLNTGANATGAHDRFAIKTVINASALGAYSLVAVDVDADGDLDLVTASNGDDTVAVYRNDGRGNFEWIRVTSGADFVLSVFAADLDHDGDVDVASASFFDGAIRWYENVLGDGLKWAQHDLRVVAGTQGHSVSGADVDGDGDVDLLAATHAENTVAVFLAVTACDAGPSAECCAFGHAWNASNGTCAACGEGFYGVGAGAAAVCAECPPTCTARGWTSTPVTCAKTTGCADLARALATCSCGENQYLDVGTDECARCARGQFKAAPEPRNASFDFDEVWVGFSEEGCEVVTNTTTVFDSGGNGPSDHTIVIALSSVVGAFVLCALAFVARAVYKSAVAALAALAAHNAAQLARCARSCEAIKTCGFSVCFISFDKFKASRGLRPHELERDCGNLVMLDTYEDVVEFAAKHPTAFFSHQWLGFTHPDPRQVHYHAMCAASETLCAKFNVEPSQLFLWVDYVSIPQKNPQLQMLSIASLSLYSSVCRYFVIVAPTTQHADANPPRTCDAKSYQNRGWCRLEQFARISCGGLSEMYLYDQHQLESIVDKPQWYADSVRVLGADFSFAEDKPKLVDTILGLYGLLLANLGHGDNALIMDLIVQNKDEVFPEQYFGQLPAILEHHIENAIAEREKALKKQPSLLFASDKRIDVIIDGE